MKSSTHVTIILVPSGVNKQRIVHWRHSCFDTGYRTGSRRRPRGILFIPLVRRPERTFSGVRRRPTLYELLEMRLDPEARAPPQVEFGRPMGCAALRSWVINIGAAGDLDIGGWTSRKCSPETHEWRCWKAHHTGSLMWQQVRRAVKGAFRPFVLHNWLGTRSK